MHGHNLVITGTPGDDVVTITQDYYLGTPMPRLQVYVNDVPSGAFGGLRQPKVRRIVIRLGEGDDQVNLRPASEPTNIDGPELASGEVRYPVRLDAGPGNDVVVAGLGGSRIDGGPGDDVLVGGAFGRNIITGGAGNDSLRGGGSRDRLDGGEGSDRLFGSDGRDRLIGGASADVFADGDDAAERMDFLASDDSVQPADDSWWPAPT